jgi:predicted nucleic acid-binding protein
MIAMGTLIVPDSCTIIQLIRNNEVGQRLERQYYLSARRNDIIISSVTYAEVLAFATYQQWSPQKIGLLEEFMDQLPLINVGDHWVIEMYVELYVAARKRGRVMSQNDLWIAATAKATDAVLLTIDKDFQWIPDELLRVIVT